MLLHVFCQWNSTEVDGIKGTQNWHNKLVELVINFSASIAFQHALQNSDSVISFYTDDESYDW